MQLFRAVLHPHILVDLEAAVFKHEGVVISVLQDSTKRCCYCQIWVQGSRYCRTKRAVTDAVEVRPVRPKVVSSEDELIHH